MWGGEGVVRVLGPAESAPPGVAAAHCRSKRKSVGTLLADIASPRTPRSRNECWFQPKKGQARGGGGRGGSRGRKRNIVGTSSGTHQIVLLAKAHEQRR